MWLERLVSRLCRVQDIVQLLNDLKLQILCRGAVCNYAPDLVGQIKKAR